jgi:Phosphatidylinositol-specific phospholipase C, X domain
MSSTINDAMHYLSNLKDDFVSRMIYCMILFIIILMLSYYLYLRNLESRECSFMNGLYSKIDGNIRSINSNDPQCGYTLKDYYIKTAYNSCSGGSYKNDFVDICNLKSILNQGVRGIDLEIYSLNDQPIVSTSTDESYFIKETYNSVKFSDVMYTIQNYAFSNSTCPNPNDPIILHLRIKSTNQNMYTNLANLLESYNNILLGKDYSYENHNTNLGNTPLLKLAGKIVIVVDRQNTSFLENKNFLEYVNMTSNSMFMRALPYNSIKQSHDVNELIDFNRKNMTICIPDVGIDPPNISGMLVRTTGTQMPAMRYQKIDAFLEENTSFFDTAGYAFVLKPDNLRYHPVTVDPPTPQNPQLSYASRTISKDYYSFQV